MTFIISGGFLVIVIDGEQRQFPNNVFGYHLMAYEFCKSKGLL